MSAAEHLVQVGMRAVIRDLQEYVEAHSREPLSARGRPGQLDSDPLRAYLLALLIMAGGYDDGEG